MKIQLSQLKEYNLPGLLVLLLSVLFVLIGFIGQTSVKTAKSVGNEVLPQPGRNLFHEVEKIQSDERPNLAQEMDFL